MAGDVTSIFNVLQKVDTILASTTAIAQAIPQFQGFVQAQSHVLGQVLQALNAAQADVTTLGTDINNGQQILSAVLAAMATADNQTHELDLLAQILKIL